MESREEDLELTGAFAHSAEQVLAAPTDGPVVRQNARHNPVVAFGGSAGAIPALQTLLTKIPEHTGISFVVIVHLSAEHESSLAEILQRSALIPVTQLRDNTKLLPDHVYVIPPGKHVSLLDGIAILEPIPRERGRRGTVDHFFRALADSFGPRAIAVVLSGADSDGSIGIKRVKERGGLTIAQDPSEAETDGMPRSAIATSMIDWVLRAEEIPGRIVDYVSRAERMDLPDEIEAEGGYELPDPEKAYGNVLSILRERTGRNFSFYKRGTVLRRIGRRMQVTTNDDIASYVRLLGSNPGEAGALAQDLLISVTNFFRDPDAFQALEKELPAIFHEKKSDETVRVWVAACATGEEAYSIAILLSEYASRLPSPPRIQIFATDIDEAALTIARLGVYSSAIGTDVSEERLQRFFTQHAGSYRVSQTLRDLILFASHDVLQDPPFSRLSLISCRNLLIYLTPDAQRKVLNTFSFALPPGGVLLLGVSESTEEAQDFYVPVDKKHRLFRRRENFLAPISGLAASLPKEKGPTSPMRLAERNAALSLPREQASPFFSSEIRPVQSMLAVHFKLLERIAPPSILVNERSEIVHMSGSAARFLQLNGGVPSTEITQLVHPALRTILRTSLYQALRSGVRVTAPNIAVDFAHGPMQFDLSVEPAAQTPPGFCLVVFNERHPSAPTDGSRSQESESLVRNLERELEAVKQQLRDTIQQHISHLEELNTSNEELQAMNAELRFTSEELETGREELQSINEELTTVNTELKFKVEQVGEANSDLQNLMAATNIATVFLDNELRIKRYTPAAVALFNLIHTDVGRPLAHMSHRLEFDSLFDDVRTVRRDLAPIEREVRSTAGRWYIARITPYRTLTDDIAGVVLTFFDVTDRKVVEDAFRAAKDELEIRVESRTAELSDLNKVLRQEIGEHARTEKIRQELQRRIVDAQEQERGRISRELHDEIGQHVTALSLGLKAITDGKAAPDTAAKLLELTQTLGREIHKVALALRPTSLDDLGLVGALSHLVHEWSMQNKVDADFHSTGLEGVRLAPHIETTIYRIVGEALNNVSKHAKAKVVSVVVEHRGPDVVAIVEDDGIGFMCDATSPHKNDDRLGLVGMKERAALLDGELTIESSEGGGTTIFARIPLLNPHGNS